MAEAFAWLCAAVNPFQGAAPLLPCPDAAAVLELAAFHGVRPALLHRLEPGAAPDLREPLALFQRSHRFTVMAMTQQLVALAQALEEAAIETLFFKGATLAAQIYGAPERREFNDIDILVPQGAKPRVWQLLAAQGFEPVIADQAMRRTFFDHHGQHMFRHRETGAVVDLHWRFVGEGPFPVEAGAALEHRTPLLLGGVAVPVADTADLALVLAGHGQKEGWASFGWALDFASFAAANRNFDWGEAARRAGTQGCRDAVLTGLLLIERLFGAVPGAALAREARARPRVAAMAAEILARYPLMQLSQQEEALAGGFRLCETAGSRAAMAWHLLTTPSIGDFEAMPLPQGMWWLYRLTRPLRIMWQRLTRRVPVVSRYWRERRAEMG